MRPVSAVRRAAGFLFEAYCDTLHSYNGIISMKFRKKTLQNGFTIITVPMPETFSATVLVLVEAGSKYEEKRINGISHFLEHMCFKGTKKRPRAIDITRELDGVGAESNAFTSQEFTGYYAKANYKKIGKLLDVVSDIYMNPVFDPKEIEKEKGVIAEEIHMYEDMPARHIQDLFMELLYGDQPAGWNIAGDVPTIKTFTRDDFVRYRDKHYVASATTLVIAGNISEREVVARAEEAFAHIPARRKHGKKKTKDDQKSPQLLVRYKKTDQAHLVIGFRSRALRHKDTPALDVLSAILGKGMSSRLFQKLREEMGIGYYVRAHNDSYTDHGILQASAGVDVGRIHEAIEAILGEFRKCRDDDVSEEELRKAKDFVIGNMYLALETSDHRAEYYGIQQVLKHAVETPREAVGKIKSVTPRDIRRVARAIFRNDRLNMAIIGPYKNSKRFSGMLKM